MDTTYSYIYLLQEREFIKTNENVFKIGMSTKKNLTRFNQYPNGSKLLFQITCNDCKILERGIISLFKTKFIQKKEYGTEYFEGCYKEMIDLIYNLVKNEIVSTEISINENKLFKIMCNLVQEEFPNYKDDIAFGGKQKLIKIKLVGDEYVAYHIRENIELLQKEFEETINKQSNWSDDKSIEESINIALEYNDIIIETRLIDIHVSSYRDGCFQDLLDNKIVELNKVYNYKSQEFLKKINKTKININIEFYDEFVNFYNIENKKYSEFGDEIITLLLTGVFLNNKIYVDTCIYNERKTKKWKNFVEDRFYFDFSNVNISFNNVVCGMSHDKGIGLLKIKNKYYDIYSFIRRYLPYIINWDKDFNYYTINRDYKNIGPNCELDTGGGGSEYLFRGSIEPWFGKNNFITMCSNYHQIIKTNALQKCLNQNIYTDTILKLLEN